jgi:hypothetical protein
MSITMIARQAQGMRAGEVITKLVEDAYFMRVGNRVAQVPPVKTRQPDNTATSCSPADNMLMVKFHQPRHEFTFGVGMSFVSYPLVLTPMV